jgi:hypothetical protein
MADDWRWRTCLRCQRRYYGPRNDTWLCKTCETLNRLKNAGT